ncbi:MAG: hypothetical protein WBA45_10060 [Microthrixaceae bacterium]
MSEQRSSGVNQVQERRVAGVEQRSLIRARELDREEPVRCAVPLGTIDAGAMADVDPAGLLQMRGASWSVDWWIGAADRWHFPSQDATVVQSLVDSTPVVQTAMHVPGGEIIHRVFAVRASSDSAPDTVPATSTGEGSTTGTGPALDPDEAPRWDDSAVVVEVENRSSTPVALAFAFVPLGLSGPGEINELSVGGNTIWVDGEVAGVLSRPVSRRVVGPPGTASIRLDMTDDEDPEGTWAVPGQLAEGAYVVPLPHTAVVRLLIPRIVGRTGGSGNRWGRRRSNVGPVPGATWQAPTSEQISSGWSVHTRDAASITTPEPLLASLLKVAESHLLVASTDVFLDGDGVVPTALRNAQLVENLVTAGIDEPLGPIARALVDSERIGGSIRMPDRSDAVVALLHAAAPLMVGSRSEVWTEDLIGAVAKGIHRIGQGKGIVPGSAQDRPLDAALGGWSLTRSAAVALSRLAPALRFVDQPEVAESAELTAQRLWAEVGTLQVELSAKLSGLADLSSQRSLLWRAILERASVISGASTAVDGLMAFARVGNLGVLGSFVDADGNSVGDIAVDPAAIAARAGAVMDLVCAEGAEGPVILPSWSPHWFDKPVEANRVRTSWGLVSYAVRWHGERPAILWEIEPAVGASSMAAPVLTAPGLDPQWRASGWSGEALLSPVQVSDEVLAEIAERATPRLSVQLGMKKPKKG